MPDRMPTTGYSGAMTERGIIADLEGESAALKRMITERDESISHLHIHVDRLLPVVQNLKNERSVLNGKLYQLREELRLGFDQQRMNFAGQAMTGLLANGEGAKLAKVSPAALAENAFTMADAMIAACKENHG